MAAHGMEMVFAGHFSLYRVCIQKISMLVGCLSEVYYEPCTDKVVVCH